VLIAGPLATPPVVWKTTEEDGNPYVVASALPCSVPFSAACYVASGYFAVLFFLSFSGPSRRIVFEEPVRLSDDDSGLAVIDFTRNAYTRFSDGSEGT
jgi:hypothetical protein